MKQQRTIKNITPLILIIILSAAFATATLASYKPLFQRNYDTQHITLKLMIDHEQKSITGTAIITVVPLISNFSVLQFHAKDLQIDSVSSADGKGLDFTADSETIAIALPQAVDRDDTITVTIHYFTRPTEGIYFNEPSVDKPADPYQVYSHSEPIYARCWFPCYDEPDDKLTSEIIATVTENFFLLSNGRLLSVQQDSSQHTKTYHWLQRQPHVTYLISIVAGEYAEIRDHCGNIPLYSYVYKDQIGFAANTFDQTPRMIRTFQRLFGHPYPWDKYAQIIVANYQAAGMEHTSATSLYDRAIHDDRAHLDANSYDLVSHELAHQWFGDLVTCRDWSHIWLNEGFATYAEILFKEEDAGIDEAQYSRYQDQKRYLDMVDTKFHQPIVYENYLHPDEMFSPIEYQKAALVLHALRYVIGDSAFFLSLKTFLNRFAFQSVVTADFQQVVEEVSGEELDWFFNQWLYQGGHPKFVVNSQWLPEAREVRLYVRQTQADSLGLVPKVFQMPIEVEIISEKERVKKQILIAAREDTFIFAFHHRPDLICFDNENWVLKELSFIKSQDEWLYQLRHDKNVAARLESLDALEKVTFDTLKTVIAVERCLASDPFWAVRQRAAYLLIDYHRPESKAVLKRACKDLNSAVREAAISALSYYYDPALNPFFRNIARRDSSYKVVAAAIYALSNTPDDSSFDFFSQFVDMNSHNDVIRTATFHALRQLKDERVVPIALRFATDPSQVEYRRVNALSILKEIGANQPEVESQMIALLSDKNNFIKKKVIDVLGQFKTQSSLLALKKLQEESLPDDVRRRVKISIEKIERNLGH